MSEKQDLEASIEQPPPLINNIPGVLGGYFEPISESSQVGNIEENSEDINNSIQKLDEM